MGKLTITLESVHLPSSTLKELADILIPDNQTMRSILLDIVGVTPESIKVTMKEE